MGETASVKEIFNSAIHRPKIPRQWKTGGAAFSRPPVPRGSRWSLCSGVPLIIRAHVVIADVDILHRGVEAFMSENVGDFLDRHSVVDQACCQSPAEPMRMHVGDSRCRPDPLEHGADPLRHESCRTFADKQCGGFVRSAVEVPLEDHGSHRVHVDLPFLVSLAEHRNLKGAEIDVFTIQRAHLRDPSAGRVEEVADCKVTVIGAALVYSRQFHRREREPHLFLCSNDGDVGHRVPFDQLLSGQPSEKRAERTPDPFDGRVCHPSGFASHQVLPDMVDRNSRDRSLDIVQHP